jgi:hypothetical protein
MKQVAVFTPTPPQTLLGDRPRGSIDMIGVVLNQEDHHDAYEHFVRACAQKDLSAMISVNFTNGEESVKLLHRNAFSKAVNGEHQLIREFKGEQGERDYLWIGQPALIDTIKTAAWKHYPEGVAQGVWMARLTATIRANDDPDPNSGFTALGSNWVITLGGSGKSGALN